MGHRWAPVPTLAGMGAILLGSLFIAAPNWGRARAEYRAGIEQHVLSQGADVGFIETAIGTGIALGRTVVFTFAAGVVHHPILTVLFGVGLILAGIWMIGEYGFVRSDEEPWHEEYDMWEN